MSGRERNDGGRGRVVYFKFFQTLGALGEKGRRRRWLRHGGSWSVMRGVERKRKRGKKERKVSHRARGIAVEIEEREGGRKEEGRVDPAPPSSH